MVEVYFFIIIFPLKIYHHLMTPITHPSTFYTSYDIEHLWFTLMIHDCYHLFIPLIDVYTILYGLTPTLLFTNLIVVNHQIIFTFKKYFRKHYGTHQIIKRAVPLVKKYLYLSPLYYRSLPIPHHYGGLNI